MPKVGAHVSAAVSLEHVFDRAQKIGAEVTQIFISPPQRWLETKHSEEEILRYKETESKTGIGPNFIHGTYLINLATQKPEHLQKSIDWLIYAMNLCRDLEMEGIIFHTGSHGGIGFDKVVDQIAQALSTILSDSEGSHYLILENSAGAGGSIGSKFQELGAILKKVNNPRLKICLDTCHLYAAGYDIKTPIGLRSTLEEFEEEVGLQNLAAIHANDCKFDLGSGKDRHENIGEGFLGTEGFTNLINNLALKDIPFILEVPGLGDAGPDAENVKILKGLYSKNGS